MRLRKLWATTLLAFSILLLALVAGSCTGGEKSGKVKIGFSMDTLKEERWVRDKELVEQYAREAGAEIEVQVANGDDAVQSKQCENMMTKGVNVLIVAPHDGVAAAAIVEMARRQNISVISYDRLIQNAEPALYVSHQVVKIGEMQGQFALERQPRGNYFLIGGSPTDFNAKLLRDGQMSVLQPAVDRKEIKIVGDPYAREWLASEARRLTDDALTQNNNNIQAIVASNDGTASGAAAALAAAGLTGKVLVTGQDASLDAVQRIVEGSQTMTIYKPIKPLAKSAVDAAMKLARGEKIEAPDRVNNGKTDVPSILHAPIVVDKEKVMETVIKDGYHKYEDVYKNVPPDQRPKQTASANGGKSGAGVLAAAMLLLFSALAWVKVRN